MISTTAPAAHPHATRGLRASHADPLNPAPLQDQVQITTAMALLASGVDISVIALWLGHESTDVTQIYLHADMAIKERALTRLAPAGRGSAGRYKPPDKLLAFLDSL